MITRIYADNFRCFQNFSLPLGDLTLLMGLNGVGKSSVLDLVTCVQRLLCGHVPVADVFPASSLCRWDTRRTLQVELHAELPDPAARSQDPGPLLPLRYTLEVVYDEDRRRAQIVGEVLTASERPLFAFRRGEVSLYRDNHSEGPSYGADWTQSALANVAERPENRRLTAFRRLISNTMVLRLDPVHMGAEAHGEDRVLALDGTNFAAWYRYLSQEHQDRVYDLTTHLREVIPGFRGFRLREAGLETRVLWVVQALDDSGDSASEYLFSELSHGQRALMVLNTLLHGSPPGVHPLFIDEPENFIALAEIQPWLMELSGACGEAVPQAVIVSHHPEVLDYLGDDRAVVLDRVGNGPVRVTQGLPDDATGLSVSERVARGWTDG